MQNYHGSTLEKEWTYLSPFWCGLTHIENKKPHLSSQTNAVSNINFLTTDMFAIHIAYIPNLIKNINISKHIYYENEK